MGTPAFPDLGKHCSVENCGQIDFLPFNCDKCHQVFCLEHRAFSQHKCPNAAKGDVTVIICPMCAKSIRLVDGEDPNVTWERHLGSNCDPSNYAKVTKKPRCPVKGCKEQLTFSNRFSCKTCKTDVCLKHRFATDHGCKERAAALVGPSFSERVLQGIRDGVSAAGFGTVGGAGAKDGSNRGAQPAKSQQGRAAPKQASATASDPSNSLRGSAARRMEGWDLSQRERERQERERAAQQAAAARAQPGGPAGALLERCSDCGARFGSVAELISHAEAYHIQQGRGSAAGTVGDSHGGDAGAERCPQCARAFRTAVDLVEHVEREHSLRRGGGSGSLSDKCRIS